MEKTINCGECGQAFSYMVPENYPDKRKYCDSCSAAKKASWEAKKNVSLDNFKPAFKPATQIVAEEPTDIRVTPEAPSKDKSIVAQCLTKCLCNSNPVDMSEQDVLDAYNFFLSRL